MFKYIFQETSECIVITYSYLDAMHFIHNIHPVYYHLVTCTVLNELIQCILHCALPLNTDIYFQDGFVEIINIFNF
jgi:hypothetical protein